MITPELARLWLWADSNQLAHHVPDYLLRPVERQHSAVIFEPQGQTHADVARDILKEAEKDLESFAYRRRVEQHMADYLERGALADEGMLYGFELSELADKLRCCRTSGTVGYRENSRGEVKHVVAWDKKCNQVRLCPDEARVEQMRLAERYVPAMQTWKKQQQGRQIQYCVLTWPNVDPGRLAEMKRAQFKHVAAWLKRDVCASVIGALAVQEDPLSSAGDWNVHMNLLLLVQGRFDWSAARKDWFRHTRALFKHRRRRDDGRPYEDFQVYFKDVKDTDLMRSLLELVKYSAKHISGKLPEIADPESRQPGEDDEGLSCEGRIHDCQDVDPGLVPGNRGPDSSHDPVQGKAPGLTAWPIARFIEWWKAGQGFRRTRSYGALYFRKDNPLFSPEEPPQEIPAVTWVGSVRWNDLAGAYQVQGGINLIPADKFGFSRGRSTEKFEPGVDPPPRWQ